MKKAWIENNIIRDVAHTNPTEIYHPDIAKLYDTNVPDEAQNGWSLINKIWTAPTIQEVIITPIIETKIISPIAFKLKFTPQERVAIYASTDPLVKDFISLLDDPRLQSIDLKLQATIDAVNYLQSIKLLTKTRATEILA